MCWSTCQTRSNTCKTCAHKFLEPDGWLLLEVPNLYAHDCFEVAHLISFSAHTLTQVVQKAGFRVIQLRAHGLPRSRLIPLYLTLLAQPDSSTQYSLKPDHLVRLKRQFGFFRRRLAERLSPRARLDTHCTHLDVNNLCPELE